MSEFTLLSFSDYAANEKNNERLTQKQQLKELKAPEKAVENILNYSKALSIRKSEKVEFIENVMN